MNSRAWTAAALVGELGDAMRQAGKESYGRIGKKACSQMEQELLENPLHTAGTLLEENDRRYREAMDKQLAQSVRASGMHSLFDGLEFATGMEIASCQRIECPELQVNLFGGLKTRIDGVEVPDYKWDKAKAKLLFAHLLVRLGREVNRETLVQALWPDMDVKRATKNLYVVYSVMRHALANPDGETPYLVTRGELYKIDSSLVWSDVAEFDDLTKKILFDSTGLLNIERYFMRIDQLYAGDMLAGIKCDPYLLRMRERFRATYIDALLMASRRTLEYGNIPAALWFARKALEMETGREDVYQALMTAQQCAGQRTSAMETFFVCKHYLDNVLGIPLSRKTLRIYESLLAGE